MWLSCLTACLLNRILNSATEQSCPYYVKIKLLLPLCLKTITAILDCLCVESPFSTCLIFTWMCFSVVPWPGQSLVSSEHQISCLSVTITSAKWNRIQHLCCGLSAVNDSSLSDKSLSLLSHAKQRRLRHLRSIAARNIVNKNGSPLLDTYFTLHLCVGDGISRGQI